MKVVNAMLFQYENTTNTFNVKHSIYRKLVVLEMRRRITGLEKNEEEKMGMGFTS
jgi:hypothetical protein